MVSGFVNLKDELVKDFIVSRYSNEAYSILLALDREGKTDEMIAKKVKLKVNEIRAYLNQLHYDGIIYYTKEKAKDSNWYTYTWFVKKERISELLKERYVELLEELKKKLEYENTYTFFKCKKGCSKLPFELAFEYDFKCPECGGVMKSYNNSKDKKKLEKEIKQIEEFLKKQEEDEVNFEKSKKQKSLKQEKKKTVKKEVKKTAKKKAVEKKKKTGRVKSKKAVAVKQKSRKKKQKARSKPVKKKKTAKKG